jgi:hypothetical protein
MVRAAISQVTVRIKWVNQSGQYLTDKKHWVDGSCWYSYHHYHPVRITGIFSCWITPHIPLLTLSFKGSSQAAQCSLLTKAKSERMRNGAGTTRGVMAAKSWGCKEGGAIPGERLHQPGRSLLKLASHHLPCRGLEGQLSKAMSCEFLKWGPAVPTPPGCGLKKKPGQGLLSYHICSWCFLKQGSFLA